MVDSLIVIEISKRWDLPSKPWYIIIYLCSQFSGGCINATDVREWLDNHLASRLGDHITNACFNTLRARQNVCHFAEDIFECVFLNANLCVSINVSLIFTLKGPIKNIQVLIPIMTWSWPGDKPLSEPMMVSLLMHIHVTRLQWVNAQCPMKFHHHTFPHNTPHQLLLLVSFKVSGMTRVSFAWMMECICIIDIFSTKISSEMKLLQCGWLITWSVFF